jgi:hypothetical protein
VFTARYALSPHIKQTHFVFKGLIWTFLPSRICEQLLHAHVLNRFHGNNQDLNAYLMSTEGAVDILGCVSSEGELVDRVLQNLHA